MKKETNSKKKLFLTFTLDSEIFAVNATRVLEVISNAQITPVPETTDTIEGIIQFRGKIIPVFNLNTILNLPVNIVESYILIVAEVINNLQKKTIGYIADTTQHIISVSDDDLLQPLPTGYGYDINFIENITITDNKALTILNLDTVFLI